MLARSVIATLIFHLEKHFANANDWFRRGARREMMENFRQTRGGNIITQASHVLRQVVKRDRDRACDEEQSAYFDRVQAQNAELQDNAPERSVILNIRLLNLHVPVHQAGAGASQLTDDAESQATMSTSPTARPPGEQQDDDSEATEGTNNRRSQRDPDTWEVLSDSDESSSSEDTLQSVHTKNLRQGNDDQSQGTLGSVHTADLRRAEPDDASTATMIMKGTITAKLKQSVTLASRGPDLLAHICSKNNWDSTVPDTVDWETHGLVRRNASHSVTHLKFLHGLLPVGVQKAHCHDRYSKCCPLCTTVEETEFHFCRCPHEARAQWRAKFLTVLTDTAAKLKVLHELTSVVVAGVTAFFSGHTVNQDHPTLDPLDFPRHLRPLIMQQNEIGWLNFIRGRWSKEWRRLQQAKNGRRLKAGKKTLKGDWAAKLIQAVWASVFEAWDDRNKVEHGIDHKTRHDAKNKLLQRDLEWRHSLQDSCPTLSQPFDTPLEDMLKKKNYQLHSWMERCRLAMQQADDDACEATRQELTQEVQALHAAHQGNPAVQQAFLVPVQVLVNRRNRALSEALAQ